MEEREGELEKDVGAGCFVSIILNVRCSAPLYEVVRVTIHFPFLTETLDGAKIECVSRFCF